jgi:hypothetical protein
MENFSGAGNAESSYIPDGGRAGAKGGRSYLMQEDFSRAKKTTHSFPWGLLLTDFQDTTGFSALLVICRVIVLYLTRKLTRYFFKSPP